MKPKQPFKWRHFLPEIILLNVRWYCRYSLSYRDLEEMMLERGVEVDHRTIHRWVQADARELDKQVRSHLQPTNDLWRVDETKATDALTADETLPKTVELRQHKYLNNLVEQDHRFIKRLVNPGMGFGSFNTARRTLRGDEAMNMLRKGQVQAVAKGDIRAQVEYARSNFWGCGITSRD